LILHGVEIGDPAKVVIDKLRDWEGNPLPVALAEDLKREQERLVMVEDQIKTIDEQQMTELLESKAPAAEKMRKLCQLKAVGQQSSRKLVNECFGWRHFANRRHLGSFSGLTGTPYDSGETLREQGISKAGNRRIRTTMIELAWLWVRWQRNSALTQWFLERYVHNGSRRSKRKGIVALARKLLIALWKYLEQDLVPAGAVLKG
jgi:transposase